MRLAPSVWKGTLRYSHSVCFMVGGIPLWSCQVPSQRRTDGQKQDAMQQLLLLLRGARLRGGMGAVSVAVSIACTILTNARPAGLDVIRCVTSVILELIQ